jgi:hypothetical protein
MEQNLGIKPGIRIYFIWSVEVLNALQGEINPISCIAPHTYKNAQVVTGLQTSCYKSVHKLSTSCVRTACSQLL